MNPRILFTFTAIVAVHLPASGRASEPDPGATRIAFAQRMAEECKLTIDPRVVSWLDLMALYEQYDAPVISAANAEMQRELETKGRINACLDFRSELHKEGWLK